MVKCFIESSLTNWLYNVSLNGFCQTDDGLWKPNPSLVTIEQSLSGEWHVLSVLWWLCVDTKESTVAICWCDNNNYARTSIKLCLCKQFWQQFYVNYITLATRQHLDHTFVTLETFFYIFVMKNIFWNQNLN